MKCAVCSIIDNKPSTEGYSDRHVHGAVASFAIGACISFGLDTIADNLCQEHGSLVRQFVEFPTIVRIQN